MNGHVELLLLAVNKGKTADHRLALTQLSGLLQTWMSKPRLITLYNLTGLCQSISALAEANATSADCCCAVKEGLVHSWLDAMTVVLRSNPLLDLHLEQARHLASAVAASLPLANEEEDDLLRMRAKDVLSHLLLVNLPALCHAVCAYSATKTNSAVLYQSGEGLVGLLSKALER